LRRLIERMPASIVAAIKPIPMRAWLHPGRKMADDRRDRS
jgi:hypothetical protein